MNFLTTDGFPVPGRVALAWLCPGIKMPQASFAPSPPTSKLVLEFRHLSVQAAVALIWGTSSPPPPGMLQWLPAPTAALGPTFWGNLPNFNPAFLSQFTAFHKPAALSAPPGREVLDGHLKCHCDVHLNSSEGFTLPFCKVESLPNLGQGFFFSLTRICVCLLWRPWGLGTYLLGNHLPQHPVQFLIQGRPWITCPMTENTISFYYEGLSIYNIYTNLYIIFKYICIYSGSIYNKD